MSTGDPKWYPCGLMGGINAAISQHARQSCVRWIEGTILTVLAVVCIDILDRLYGERGSGFIFYDPGSHETTDHDEKKGG